jgi:hypothetical protein
LIKVDLEKLARIIGGVDTAVQNVQSVIDASGAGGNLNEEQIVHLEHMFAVLAETALTAYHEAHDIPFTPETIAALLPDVEDTILPPPEPAPVVEASDAPASDTSTAVAAADDSAAAASSDAPADASASASDVTA